MSKINKLTYITAAEAPDPNKNIGRFKYGLFKCACGNEKVIRLASVKNGHTTSCGCVQKESIRNVGLSHKIGYGEASKNALYAKYKQGADKRGLPFNITLDEFTKITKQNCRYCNASPSQVYTNRRANGPYIYNGIDRLDNSIGYDATNIVACCWTCNRMKSIFSDKEFIAHIKKINSFVQ